MFCFNFCWFYVFSSFFPLLKHHRIVSLPKRKAKNWHIETKSVTTQPTWRVFSSQPNKQHINRRGCLGTIYLFSLLQVNRFKNMKKRKQKKRKRKSKQYTQHNKLKVPNEPVWVKSRGLTVFLGHIYAKIHQQNFEFMLTVLNRFCQQVTCYISSPWWPW